MEERKTLVRATDYIRIEGWMWSWVGDDPFDVIIYAYIYGWTIFRGYAWARRDYLEELLNFSDDETDIYVNDLVCRERISRKKIKGIGEVWVAEIPFVKEDE